MTDFEIARIDAMKRELWSDLMDRVEAEEITAIDAMECYNDKCDQWVNGR